MKIALIALQKSLNAAMLVAVQTVPGHSFRNPVKKVNCILNIGLYGIGVMGQKKTRSFFSKKSLTQQLILMRLGNYCRKKQPIPTF